MVRPPDDVRPGQDGPCTWKPSAGDRLGRLCARCWHIDYVHINDAGRCPVCVLEALIIELEQKIRA